VDLIGYETRDPAILHHLCSDCPRIVGHDLIRQIGDPWSRGFDLGSEPLWVTASRQANEDQLVRFRKLLRPGGGPGTLLSIDLTVSLEALL